MGEDVAPYRTGDGHEAALIPERVMVCMSSIAATRRVLRTGARIAHHLGAKWYAVYVETPHERPPRIPPNYLQALRENMNFAESLGLIAFAQREGITHVIFGQSARSRWEVLWHGSTIDHFLRTIHDAAVQIVPFEDRSV